jgi:hypothetical protein
MQRMDAMDGAAIVFRIVSSAVLVLSLVFSGCNTCYSGFWNGNGSGVGVSNSSCPLTKATGTVLVQVRTSFAPPAAPAATASRPASPRDVQHVFVTLRGILSHASLMADENSPGWQELVPDLASHPMQLDLLAVSGDSRLLGPPAGANVPVTVPADAYRQLRLRLVPLHPSPDDLTPESNACGSVGWNCIVFADRSVQPLESDDAEAEFHIPLEHGADGVFRVLPDETIRLSIEFDAASSVFFVSNGTFRLVPVFRIVSAASPAASAH